MQAVLVSYFLADPYEIIFYNYPFTKERPKWNKKT